MRRKHISTMKLAAFLFAIAYFAKCGSIKQPDQWDAVAIDSTISRSAVYRGLDKQPEFFSAHEKRDASFRKTSDVAYISGQNLKLSDNKYAKFNNCRAYFFHSDTIRINIGIATGFGGKGFAIHYKEKKFYTEPYFATDVIVEDEVEPTFKIVYQKLVLNKLHYRPGDSLYGFIDFRSIELDKSNDTTVHVGKGYFRTKVTIR